MARPLDPSQLDYAIKLYLAGKTRQEIASASGVPASCLNRERVARGIPPRKLHVLPVESIVAAYESGASVYGLARQYGISRGPIDRVLAEAGVKPRGMSDAGLTRNAHLSFEERKAQTAAANRAARMRRVPQIAKLRRALDAERKGVHQSDGERMLAEMLAQRGVETTAHRAIGAYNIDLAALPVAVEILGGGWHSIKAVHAERTPYILDEGWHLVMVWDYEGLSTLGMGAADYIVAFVEQMRRNPPATCQYRVITGQGELLAACGREDNEFPLEPPPRGGV